MERTIKFIPLLLCLLLSSACGSDQEGTVHHNQKVANVDAETNKNQLWVIFCDYPQQLQDEASASQSHTSQLLNRIKPVTELINKHMSETDQLKDIYSIKLYPLYEYSANADLMGQYTCSSTEGLDLAHTIRNQECKKAIRKSLRKFTEKVESNGRISIINSIKALDFVNHQSEDYDDIQIFYISNLVERIHHPNREKCEFNFVDENNYLDPISFSSARGQLNDESSPLRQLIDQVDLTGLRNKVDKIHIIPLTDYRVKNRKGMSMSDVRRFWLDFFKTCGLKARFYDSIKEVNL